MATARKTPDDEPAEFNLDAVKDEAEYAPFRFVWNGRRWTFTHVQLLDAWEVAAASDEGDIKGSVALMRVALGDAKKWAEFQKIKLPQHKMNKLTNAYLKHCGLEPGELAGSGDS